MFASLQPIQFDQVLIAALVGSTFGWFGGLAFGAIAREVLSSLFRRSDEDS